MRRARREAFAALGPPPRLPCPGQRRGVGDASPAPAAAASASGAGRDRPRPSTCTRTCTPGTPQVRMRGATDPRPAGGSPAGDRVAHV